MPCYTVQTVSVAFKVAHVDLLELAIRALGWSSVESYDRNKLVVGPIGVSLVINLATGQAEVRADQQPRLNELKRAYSHEAIKLAAKLGGWQVKNLSSTSGQLVRGCL